MHAYTCPDCRQPLAGLFCAGCGHEFPCVDGVPRLLTRDPRYARGAELAAAYDAIYGAQTGVWEVQGRTPEFIRFFSSLLAGFRPARLLEIGCGEGYLLAALNGEEKFAVDLSLEAIRRARTRGAAQFSLALSERLPFPDAHFDLVTSVGVMEHFIDIDESLREIRRILRPGGHYVSLTHVERSLGERVAAKLSEFLLPWPRPLRMLRWLRSKLGPPLVQQPIQNRYTMAGAQAWLQRAGFTVREILRGSARAGLPLIGSYVVIYVARK